MSEAEEKTGTVRIEVWSDVVCPWCYIGKRRLERALADFGHADEVAVVWRSFQLDPSFPRGVRQPVPEMLAKKTGASPEQVRAMNERVTELAAREGLDYALERTVMVNTVDAHRLTHLAKEHGLGGRAHERLLRAQLVEARTLDDPDTLVRLGTEIGLDEAEARRVVTGDAYAREVEADIREARTLGVTGVPFFAFNRAFAVSGAQPAETFLTALRRAHEHARTPSAS
ncbi:DsbA family oxidoreductase [Streptomyces sp. TRM 70361]|uniref:DsbA family oxidoreductase n=1 Tax=Streptomyces sp. TRM 70361 TaxID=3116553 RepID=UPI002E7B704C|nr:DsbA family oxidoreductase [Streptomyces sp. TRM 70361]MEE1938087.1 DsbA family oxidoreductase [Streptomyces sp. TRM 70361]